MFAEALEVLIEVQDVDPRVLGGDGGRQVREGEAMGAVRAVGGKLAQHRPAERRPR